MSAVALATLLSVTLRLRLLHDWYTIAAATTWGFLPYRLTPPAFLRLSTRTSCLVSTGILETIRGM